MPTWVDALLQKRREQGASPFPHQAAFMLDNPVRRALFKPARVVEVIGLTGSEQVLELGPGPGFYSVAIARRLTYGQLNLFDLQAEMLEKARRRLERAGFHNVGFTTGQASEELPFAESSFDTAFLAAVIGEVPDKPACIRSLRRVLRPGGRLVFAETFPDPDRVERAGSPRPRRTCWLPVRLGDREPLARRRRLQQRQSLTVLATVVRAAGHDVNGRRDGVVVGEPAEHDGRARDDAGQHGHHRFKFDGVKRLFQLVADRDS
jgi:ubiquinone/menaquinone biosynthesis C-methylase UbiE